MNIFFFFLVWTNLRFVINFCVVESPKVILGFFFKKNFYLKTLIISMAIWYAFLGGDIDGMLMMNNWLLQKNNSKFG